jgi:hypothetical protein
MLRVLFLLEYPPMTMTIFLVVWLSAYWTDEIYQWHCRVTGGK